MEGLHYWEVSEMSNTVSNTVVEGAFSKGGTHLQDVCGSGWHL